MSKNIKLTGDIVKDFALFGSLLESELISSANITDTISYADFIDNYLNLGISLKEEQLIIPFTFYNEELSQAQRELLVRWIANGRANFAQLTKNTPQSVMKKVLTGILEGNPYEFQSKPQTLVLECGRRGGKSTIAQTMVAYEFMKLCMMDSPQKHYGIATSTPISILVLATTAEQSKKTLFRPLTEMIKSTPFFSSLIERGELFIGKEEIIHESKNLYIQMGNSNSASLVGGSIICLVVDEVALFSDAINVINNLAISSTPFGEDAVTLLLSSAYYHKDPIEELYKSTEGSDNSIGFRLRSQDLNPGIENHPMVRRVYEVNHAQGKLEFEGIRPIVTNAFFSGSLVSKCLTGSSCISVVQERSLISGYEYTTVKIEELTCPATSYYALHLDPAINSDSYVLAFGHAELIDKTDVLYSIDGIVAWEPTTSHPVNFANVGKIIREINNTCPLAYVTADHYCSVETLQALRSLGIKTESVHYSNTKQLEIATILRTAMAANKVSFPKDSQYIDKLFTEMTSLAQVGKRLDHPVGGSKDIYDAIAGVVFKLQTVSTQLIERGRVVTASSLLDRWQGRNQSGLIPNHVKEDYTLFRDVSRQRLSAMMRKSI